MTKMRFVGFPCAYGMPYFDFSCSGGMAVFRSSPALTGDPRFRFPRHWRVRASVMQSCSRETSPRFFVFPHTCGSTPRFSGKTEWWWRFRYYWGTDFWGTRNRNRRAAAMRQPYNTVSFFIMHSSLCIEKGRPRNGTAFVKIIG